MLRVSFLCIYESLNIIPYFICTPGRPGEIQFHRRGVGLPVWRGESTQTSQRIRHTASTTLLADINGRCHAPGTVFKISPNLVHTHRFTNKRAHCRVIHLLPDHIISIELCSHTVVVKRQIACDLIVMASIQLFG